jgi:hypothetical protein
MRIVTPAEIQNLGQVDDGAGRTENHAAAKREPAEPGPGDFYWHEDTPPMPLWQGILIALRHMLGMRISAAWYEDISRPEAASKGGAAVRLAVCFPDQLLEHFQAKWTPVRVKKMR